MRVELFYAPGCEKCADSKDKLKALAKELVPGLVWRELNVLDKFDYAVEVGVLTLPSIAIDGEVIAGQSLQRVTRKCSSELSKQFTQNSGDCRWDKVVVSLTTQAM
jgi:thioredoxin 1